MELYEWQEKALIEVFAKKKLLVEVATGAGKTKFAIEFLKIWTEKNPDSRILIVVPKIVILEQTWLKDLAKNGFGPNKVGVYYSSAKEYSNIMLTTMASVTKVNIELFDTIIIDEVHNMMTKRLMEIIEKEKFDKMIGLSATIDQKDYRHWGLIRAFDFNIFKYDTKQAIDDNIISGMSFINIGLPFDDMELRGKYAEIQGHITMMNHAIRAKRFKGESSSVERVAMYKSVNERNDIVYSYPTKMEKTIDIVKENIGKKIIIFNQRNEISTKLYWMLHDVDGARAVIVNSSIKKLQQHININKFASGEANIMLASISLDEGYNLPNIDIALLLSGNSTSRQTIQRIGRVLRKAKGKDEAKVYQIYLKDSCEQKHSDKRASFFKTIASSFKEELCH